MLTGTGKNARSGQATVSTVGAVREATVHDVAIAVAAARASPRGLAARSATTTPRVLTRAAALLRAVRRSRSPSRPGERQGNPPGSRRGVMGAAALLGIERPTSVRFAAGYMAPTGRAPGKRGRTLTIVERVPLGMSSCVVPHSTSPVRHSVEKAGAALAAGSTVVLKPPRRTRWPRWRRRALIDAGLPDGLTVSPAGAR